MTDDELKALFEANAAETRRRFDTLETSAVETRRRFDTLEASAVETRRRFDTLEASAVETRRHFDIIAEGLRHEIRLVAEKVTGVDERLTLEASDIRGEMRQGFADTHAMLKFSHAALERRVGPLEEGRQTTEENVADLQVRVERLEKPTH